LLVFWFAAWAAAMWAHRPTVEADAGVRYLWWLSAPMFVLFLVFGFKTGGGELNWPVAAYLSGMVLAGAWLERQLSSPVRWYVRWTRINVALACAVGLAVTLVIHRSDWLYPLLTRLAGPPTEARAFPLRRLDPTCRLRGWRATLAREVDRLRAELAAQGDEPVLAGCSWNLPGELGVYCAGHPQAYSLGGLMGERYSQYDLWLGPLSQAAAFRDRTFLIVGGLPDEVNKAFREVGPMHTVVHREKGQPIAVWPVTVCRGFKGFPPLSKPRGN
jgi:hypothetical protein